MSQSVAVLGSNSVPLVQQVQTNQTLTVLTGTGVFDGTSASGDFVPCLSYYDSDNNLITRAKADTVTAGGSAEVSWFPGAGVETTGGSAVTTAEWFYVSRSTTFTMLAGTSDTIPWSSLHSSDSTLFSLATDNHPNDAVQVARQGVLMVSSYLLPTAIGTDFVVGINNNLVGFGVIGENTQTPDKQFNRDGLPGGGTFGPRDISLMAMSEVPQQVTARYHNFDAANRVLNGAQMAGFWWPSSELIS